MVVSVLHQYASTRKVTFCYILCIFPLILVLYDGRWGFIQFTKNSVNSTTFQLPSFWPVYVALVAVYDAEKVRLVTG